MMLVLIVDNDGKRLLFVLGQLVAVESGYTFGNGLDKQELSGYCEVWLVGRDDPITLRLTVEEFHAKLMESVQSMARQSQLATAPTLSLGRG